MRGVSFGSLLLIFFIVILLFGTKRIREIGNDLGAAVRSFRKGMQEEVVVVEEKKDKLGS
jgi:sec-independent protein translocase protein TatA